MRPETAARLADEHCPECEGEGLVDCDRCAGSGLPTTGPIDSGTCGSCGGSGTRPCSCAAERYADDMADLGIDRRKQEREARDWQRARDAEVD